MDGVSGAPDRHVGRGVDCEARDTQDPRRPALRIQVTRPKMPEMFWKGIDRGSSSAHALITRCEQ
jgi:hypothetical protein